MKPSKSIYPTLMICLIAGAVLSIMAPYGTTALPLSLRALYWVSLSLIGGIGVFWVNHKWIGDKPLPLWKKIGLRSVASTVLVLGVLLVMSQTLSSRISTPPTALLILYVAVISAIINTLTTLFTSNRNATLQIEGVTKHQLQKNTPPKIMARLPMNLRTATIYALKAQDHYVQVLTDQGSALIHMRFRDAVVETTPITGLQPHRSWWVTQDAVENIKGNLITLRTGQTIPISRKGKSQLRAANWH